MARVALYYPWIYLKSGIERTIVEVYLRSRHDITIYTSHFDRDATFEEMRGFSVREIGHVSVKRNYIEVLRAARTIFRLRFPASDHDAVVIFCDGLGPLLTFRNRHLPLMNMCFTPLRAVYDKEYRKRLMEKKGAPRMGKLFAEWTFRLIDRRAWRHFDSVICNSRTTRDRAVDGGLRDASDLIVAYPGVAASAIRGQGPIGDYFFLPGRIMWTKNIEMAIEAYRLYRNQGGRLGLIIAGMVDRKSQAYYAELKAKAAGIDDISFETEVSDARMRELYEGCRAVLLSAFNEDQGLTPLEGMTCGKPSVAVDRGGPRESILNAVTGFLTEPDPGQFAAAMLRLDKEDGLAAKMGAAGLERVKDFTWEKFVEVFDSELDRIVDGARRAAGRADRKADLAQPLVGERS